MVKKSSTRVMITCPNSMLEKIDSRASELGINRSAFIIMSVSRSMQNDEVLQNLPQFTSGIKEFTNAVNSVTDASRKDE